tara:strand:- start:1039 stop:1845 length:807 start_codon:yes stop_codon:yes gene_type:complete
MKRIYEFTVNKEELVKEESVEKKKDGTEVTTAKDIKKDVPYKFFLRRPTRAMTDEAELYYGVRLAEGIRAGLLTRALLEKRFENDGGTRSDEENQKYKKITDKLKKFYEEQSRIIDIDEKKRSSAQKKRLKELEGEVKPVRRELRNLQMEEDGLYEETAESRARNKVILWWMLHLSHAEQDSKEVEFFGSGKLEDKLKYYDDIDEGEDIFDIVVARKFAYYVSFWFVGRPNSQREFQEMVDLALKLDEDEGELEEKKTDEEEEKKNAA